MPFDSATAKLYAHLRRQKREKRQESRRRRGRFLREAQLKHRMTTSAQRKLAAEQKALVNADPVSSRTRLKKQRIEPDSTEGEAAAVLAAMAKDSSALLPQSQSPPKRSHHKKPSKKLFIASSSKKKLKSKATEVEVQEEANQWTNFKEARKEREFMRFSAAAPPRSNRLIKRRRVLKQSDNLDDERVSVITQSLVVRKSSGEDKTNSTSALESGYENYPMFATRTKLPSVPPPLNPVSGSSFTHRGETATPSHALTTKSIFPTVMACSLPGV